MERQSVRSTPTYDDAEVIAAFRLVGEVLARKLLAVTSPDSNEEAPPSIDGPLLLGPNEAAARLGISRSGLWRLHAGGEIKSTMVGARRKFASEELERYAREGRKKSRRR